MASIVVTFVFDRKTGKKRLKVEYESDSDRTELEHEKRHRKIVEALVGKDEAAAAAARRREARAEGEGDREERAEGGRQRESETRKG